MNKKQQKRIHYYIRFLHFAITKYVETWLPNNTHGNGYQITRMVMATK
jgi:hypothetical protein